MFISFVIPMYNEELYLSDSINSVVGLNLDKYEIIIIDDHSTDRSYEIAESFCKNFDNIKVYTNDGKGKVSGLNLGFMKSCGEIIKFVDADDTIEDGWGEFSDLKENQALCHDYFICDKGMKRINVFHMNQVLIKSNFLEVAENMASCPRPNWSFHREIAKKIFPLPVELPFEDVWFSLIIARFAEVVHIEKPLYSYRQHDAQTFGGIYNFSRKIFIFRANRMLGVIDVVLKNPDRFDHAQFSLDKITEFYRLLSKEDVGFFKILKSNVSVLGKCKLMLYTHFNYLGPFALKAKWFIDGFRRRYFKL